LLVKGKGDGSIFNNIKMLINRTVPFTSVLIATMHGEQLPTSCFRTYVHRD
jgi:hypothetical protein